MQSEAYSTLLTDYSNGVLIITLNRPHKRNAMNYQMVCELMSVFDAAEAQTEVRAIVLRGSDGHFCAGGDISKMRDVRGSDQQTLSPQEAVWEFNRSFGRMITRANQSSKVVVAVLEGAVLGGGFGLACVSDVAIADKHARFAMPETGLGVIPAQIAPFVVNRIGLTQARRLALLGESIDGEEARRLGMIHYVTNHHDEMQIRLDKVLDKVRRCAPNATALTKKLMLDVGNMELEALLDGAADMFAEAISSEEGQEGTQAFMEKRSPAWVSSSSSQDSGAHK